jgi:hypothetical protein
MLAYNCKGPCGQVMAGVLPNAEALAMSLRQMLRLYAMEAYAECLRTVTARKDDAPAADQAAMSNVAGWCSISVGGGLIQTTSG